MKQRKQSHRSIKVNLNALLRRNFTSSDHILSDLKLRRVFLAVNFVNTNVPEGRTQVLLSGKEVKKLRDEGPDIFKKLNIDWHIDRPNVLFSSKLSAYYTIDNKSNHSSEYHPEFQDKLIQENYEECGYPNQIKLMKPQTKMRCCKVRRILCYHDPDEIFYPEKYAYHLFLLIYSFQDEKGILSVCLPSYQNKYLEPGVQTVVSSNKV